MPECSGTSDIELMLPNKHSNSRSPYRLTTSERMRGVANRIMFSRYYIIFYLVMTGLSLGTVILSLLEGDSNEVFSEFNSCANSLSPWPTRWMPVDNMAYPRDHRQRRHGARSRNKMGRVWQGERSPTRSNSQESSSHIPPLLQQYPLTPLNVLDLFLTAFCIITLIVVFLNPCGAGSKREL